MCRGLQKLSDEDSGADLKYQLLVSVVTQVVDSGEDSKHHLVSAVIQFVDCENSNYQLERVVTQVADVCSDFRRFERCERRVGLVVSQVGWIPGGNHEVVDMEIAASPCNVVLEFVGDGEEGRSTSGTREAHGEHIHDLVGRDGPGEGQVPV